jgi:glycosyltransferase involved in cell wall biosynthesis
MTTGASRIAVVIPALNEEASIRAVVESVLPLGLDVIVIDDGSRDGTRAALEGLAVTLIVHPQRQGKGEALVDGFRLAITRGCDGVISMDGDGQHAAADIPRLLAAQRTAPGALLLCARTVGREIQPGLRHFANNFADFWVSWAAGLPIRDSQCGQRLYPRALLEALPAHVAGGFAFESEILIEAARRGVPILSLAIEARYAPGRRASHFRPLLDVWRITRMIAGKLIRRGMYPAGLWRALTRPVGEATL